MGLERNSLCLSSPGRTRDREGLAAALAGGDHEGVGVVGEAEQARRAGAHDGEALVHSCTAFLSLPRMVGSIPTGWVPSITKITTG